jgi:co-chaperonin GroES (HSP10)
MADIRTGYSPEDWAFKPRESVDYRQPLLLPLNGRIVVEAISEEKTPSGLYLPTNTSSEQRTTIGKVVALPGFNYEELDEVERRRYHEGTGGCEDYQGDLMIGDVVLFGQNSGMLMDVGVGSARRRAIILRESEVLCKVRKADGSPYA